MSYKFRPGLTTFYQFAHFSCLIYLVLLKLNKTSFYRFPQSKTQSLLLISKLWNLATKLWPWHLYNFLIESWDEAFCGYTSGSVAYMMEKPSYEMEKVGSRISLLKPWRSKHKKRKGLPNICTKILKEWNNIIWK